MSDDHDFTLTMFGAVADEVSSAMESAVERATGLRGEAAAALTALLNTPRLSVKDLARFLDMRSPSAVQLVARLESEGLVERRPGQDARTRALILTASGRRRATRVLDARRVAVEQHVGGLSQRQRERLQDVLATVLGSLRASEIDLDHLCRRCDESACTAGRCPVGHGAPAGG